MVQYPAKPFLSNITGSYVLVPVDVRPERSFEIVGVDHFDVVDARLTSHPGISKARWCEAPIAYARGSERMPGA
jgi:hypothetical protein